MMSVSLLSMITGVLFGLVPLAWGIYHRRFRASLIGFLIAWLGGFAFGWLWGIPLVVVALALVISFTHEDQRDPFTSRVSLDEVDFEESNTQFVLRQMIALGNFTRQTWKMLLRNKGGFIGFVGIVFFISMSVFGPYFVEYEGTPQMARRQEGQLTLFREPCIPVLGCEDEPFLLGLDFQGRSILSHIVHGGRNLILTSVQAGLLSTFIAVLLGSAAGLLGGLVDQLISGVGNFILTIPQFPLLLVLATVMNFDAQWMLAVLLAALTWPGLMRAIRAQVLSLKERDYVEAAIALDLGLWHIITREVFPNMVSYIAINMIFAIRSAMYAIVGLVLLGMVPLSEPDWGVMIWNSSRQGAFFNRSAMWMALSPIMAIALFQLSLVLFTRSLEEIFNPRLRSGL
ncbi:MAG: ABC transporter permease [Anaerolineae bacterium]